MRALLGLAAAGLAVVAIGFWLSSDGNSATEITSGVKSTTPTATISVWDIHNRANLEFLPVQQIQDETVVFNAAQR